jgi:hypothetical protein
MQIQRSVERGRIGAHLGVVGANPVSPVLSKIIIRSPLLRQPGSRRLGPAFGRCLIYGHGGDHSHLAQIEELVTDRLEDCVGLVQIQLIT